MSNTEWPASVPNDGGNGKGNPNLFNRAGQSSKKRHSSPGSQPQKEPGEELPSRKGDDPPWDEPCSPQCDNMGGDNAITHPRPTGYQFHDVELAGSPADYFYRLSLDTLQVAVRGEWLDPEAGARMFNWRSLAENADSLGLPRLRFSCADDIELEVYPHGGRAGYHVLMRAPDLPELRAVPHLPSLPTFMIRFGARWCFERTPSDTERWINETLSAVDFKIEEILLSEVHIRCDVTTPFDKADLERLRGHGTRNGDFNVYYNEGRVATITNIGGHKSINYAIYDKRLEQVRKRGAFWGGVWKAYSIPEDKPIWRVEARFRGERLKNTHGLYFLSDLDAEAMEMLWHDFSSRYLKVVADPSVRTSRSKLHPKWAPVADCGEHHEPRPMRFKTNISQSHGIKTAAGHIISEMRKAFLFVDEASIAHAVQKVFDHIDIEDDESFLLTTQELIDTYVEMIDRHHDELLIDQKDWQDELKKELYRRKGLKWRSEAVSGKPAKKEENDD